MSKLRYALLFVLGLSVAVGVASLQTAPGYMDAEYYYYGGLRIANGEGFTENVLWNYLDDPEGLPHPSHTYWMPLTSIVAAIGLKVFRFLGDFNAAQVGFVLILATIPPLTAGLCMALTKRKDMAALAGILAVFSGFYLPISTTTESFGPVMLLGGVFFLLVHKGGKYRYLLLGVVAGLMHLTRADGILWVLVAGFVLHKNSESESKQTGLKARIRTWFSREFLISAFSIAIGYWVVMGFWYIRNVKLYGGLFPPGGSQTLWMLGYDDLFSYPASLLSFGRWWASGLGEIIRVRFHALGVNLQSGFIVQGVIMLGPLALLGVWKYRRKKAIKVGWTAWLLLLFMMTVVFPESGTRGGFFHSGAAFMPLIWALVPVGLEVLVGLSLKIFKKWKAERIGPFLRVLSVGVAVLISLSAVNSKIIGPDESEQPLWTLIARKYQSLEDRIQFLGANSEDIVLVNNPPGYAVVSGRPAIVIPNGGTETLMEVVRRYKPRYVLLEPDHPKGLTALYNDPGNLPGLIYLETFESTHIFIVEGGTP